MTYETITTSSEGTQQLGSRLSQLLKGGEVIELLSDLGGGKTTFTQGLLDGLGYDGPVTSPTFSISNIYRLRSNREVHHYDLYRLTEGGVVSNELLEEVGDPQIITLIEWPGLVEAGLPADRLTIKFEVTGENSRTITFAGAGQRAQQIIEGLQT